MTRARRRQLRRNIEVSLVLLAPAAVGASWAVYKTGDGWNSVGAAIAGAVLIYCVFEAANRLISPTRQEQLQEELLDRVGMATSIRDFGVETVTTLGTVDWKRFFRDQQGDTLLVALTLESWSGDYAASVVDEVGRDRLTLVLASDQTAQRHNRDGTSYEVHERAQGTVDLFEKLMKEQDLEERLDVFRATNEFPFSIYAKGTRMWLVMSPLDGHRSSALPAILCHNTEDGKSLFEWAMKQATAMQDRAVLIPDGPTTNDQRHQTRNAGA
jgi:hypothetical protein